MSLSAGKYYGFIPPSGEYGAEWPQHFVLPQGLSGLLSSAGWTRDYIADPFNPNAPSSNFGNEGFVQQTFLGASIRDFNISAGFGDSSSTLSLNLVNDEYNKSDGFGFGGGDDPYHNGQQDTFRPPVVGTPVFFKFGKNPATIEQAYRQTFDDLYKIDTLSSFRRTPTNIWGYQFPKTSAVRPKDAEGNNDKFPPENFTQLEPYFLYDSITETIEDRSSLWDIRSPFRGRNHFVFGGILQSYTQNKSSSGKPLYPVNVKDPREILSNVQVLLNNYQGTTFNNKNIINLYGFLEYDPSPELLTYLEGQKKMAGIVKKSVSSDGFVSYNGNVSYWDSVTGWETSDIPADIQTDGYVWTSQDGESEYEREPASVNLKDQYIFPKQPYSASNENPPEFFPITGQGFSRRSDLGMPWYRVSQGLAAIFEQYGELPKGPGQDESEFKTAGFGGQINFRGYNYVVDFGGIPLEKIPLLYYLDFDKIDLLSLAQELCDIISHELYVTLLPVIDHPACEYIYANNNKLVKQGRGNEIVAGIIRLDAIDKTRQPVYGAIKSYLDNLETRGINIENQDVGFELSNVTTDKFVAGGQEVDMYYFGSERDRDTLAKAEGLTDIVNDLNVKQWDIRCQLQQQILPYYGLLGEKAVTIPKGFGPYQQILLDSRNLNAFGVGNYYVATEMELRAALVDYKSWKQFLLSYNDTYIEDIAEHSALISSLSAQDSQINEVVSEFKEAVNVEGLDDPTKINEYLDKINTKRFAVTVPRCVWNTDEPLIPMDETTGLPSSPCSPPYGYPLYYQRARSIGMVEAGVGKLIDAKTKLIKSTAEIKSKFENRDAPLADIATPASYNKHVRRLEQRLKDKIKEAGDNVGQFKASKGYKSLVSAIEEAKRNLDNWKSLENNLGANSNRVSELETIIGKDGADGTMSRFLYNINNEGQRHEENAKKVYEFVKKIAEECLGKKFLVRLPKSCNMNFSDTVTTFGTFASNNFKTGPFGFKPRPLSADPNYEQSTEWLVQLDIYKFYNPAQFDMLFHPYLVDNSDPIDFNSPKIPIANRFSEGAMKGNYNPFTEQWEWNYKPEPQGGFFTYGQFGKNTSSVDFTDLAGQWGKLPLTIQQGLCPVDTKNLLSESKRIQAYAKYNNSHLLDFAGVQASDMSQQTIGIGGQFSPDVVESLPNNQEQKPDLSFSSLENWEKAQRLKQAQQDSMAFVKIQLDEKLYLPPKVVSRNTEVYGDNYLLDLIIPAPEPVETIGSDGCTKETKISFPYITPKFSLPPDGGADGRFVSVADFDRKPVSDPDSLSNEVVTDLEKLDDEHVYALITVPGRIKSTADIRWADGPLQAYKAVEKKHLMLQDVVNIPDFNKPNLPVKKPDRDRLLCGEAPVFGVGDGSQSEYEAAEAAAELDAENYGLTGSHWRPDAFDLKQERDNGIPLPPDGYRPGQREDWIQVTLEQVTSAREMTKKINRSLRLSTPESSLGYTSPSPIFPDMVALPLMSMERCYGPWLSATQLDPAADARIKYSNIGGKVEFIKKEELAPWNYAGYQLMDEAGSLEANFSNSLLLFSERGGFVIPDAPTGIALATALQQGGPIITNIGISVGTGGVKTTVKMDLYTSQFGKLAKQKEMAISQIARERQKLADTQNAASRRGLGKRSTSADLVNGVMQAGGKQLLAEVNANTALQESNREFAKEIDDQVLIVGKDGATSMGSKDALRKLAQMGTAESRAALQNDVIIQNGSQWSPYSNLPSNQLPMSENPNNRAMDRRTDANQNPGREQ